MREEGRGRGARHADHHAQASMVITLQTYIDLHILYKLYGVSHKKLYLVCYGPPNKV